MPWALNSVILWWALSKVKSRGYSHVKVYGDVLPKWVSFFTRKSLDMTIQKILKQRVPFYEKCKKKLKSAVFEVKKKQLKMGPDFQNFGEKNSQTNHFGGEKILPYISNFIPISYFKTKSIKTPYG